MTRSIRESFERRQKLKVEFHHFNVNDAQADAFLFSHIHFMPPCCLKIFIFSARLLALINFPNQCWNSFFSSFSPPSSSARWFRRAAIQSCEVGKKNLKPTSRIKNVYNNLWYWKNLLFGHDKQIKMQIIIKLYIRGLLGFAIRTKFENLIQFHPIF